MRDRFFSMRFCEFLSSCLILTCLIPCVSTAESPYAPGPGKYPRFDAKDAEPGVEYGVLEDFPLPKTILYSLGADELLADAEEWARSGFSAFFLTGIAGDWSSDVWAADGKPWTIGVSDTTFQTVKKANELCHKLDCDVFLTTAFSHEYDWFDDNAWPKIENNFRQNAIFARETGCTGIAVDIEYIHRQYHFNWPGYSYDGYTREDVVKAIQARMTGIIRAMYDEFPDMVFLTFPECGAGLGGLIHVAWIEEAARRKAPGGIHVCQEYTYRRPNLRYVFGHAWMNSLFYQKNLSERGKSYWREKCSISPGLWPFGEDPEDYHGAPPSIEEFRQGVAASLMIGRRYNWIYSHNARALMLGRNTESYPGGENCGEFMKILKERKVALNPAYAAAAKDLRRLELRDYSPELGVSVVVSLAGPREEGEFSLMPCEVINRSVLRDMQPQLWDISLRVLKGELVDFPKELGTNTKWMLLGPFDNAGKKGFDTAYPPESELKTDGEYDGVNGKIRWSEFTPTSPRNASVNLAGIFEPTEEVCAYALCYVHSPKAQHVQIRLGANDTSKLWVGGELVFKDTFEGRALLDKDVVELDLKAGATPILLKVCNNKLDWAFIFRITDQNGDPVPGLTYRLTP